MSIRVERPVPVRSKNLNEQENDSLIQLIEKENGVVNINKKNFKS